MDILVQKLVDLEGHISFRSLSSILTGLQSMSNDDVEVERVLKTLNGKNLIKPLNK